MTLLYPLARANCLSLAMSLSIRVCLFYTSAQVWITCLLCGQRHFYLSVSCKNWLFKKLAMSFLLLYSVCMRRDRFFVKKPLGEETFTDDVRLVHQIKHVLRHELLDEIILFNGEESCDFVYQITAIGKQSLSLSLKEKIVKDNFCPKTVLCLSPIRKELFEYSCLKATELGVTDIIPVLCDHTDKQFLNKNRLETIVIEGAEQSGRTDVPVIHETIHFSQIDKTLSSLSVSSRYALHFGGIQPHRFIGMHKSEEPLAFIVGPEGGFSDEEASSFKSMGATTLTIQTPIMRAETAAITCIYLASLLRK